MKNVKFNHYEIIVTSVTIFCFSSGIFAFALFAYNVMMYGVNM